MRVAWCYIFYCGGVWCTFYFISKLVRRVCVCVTSNTCTTVRCCRTLLNPNSWWRGCTWSSCNSTQQKEVLREFISATRNNEACGVMVALQNMRYSFILQSNICSLYAPLPALIAFSYLCQSNCNYYSVVRATRTLRLPYLGLVVLNIYSKVTMMVNPWCLWMVCKLVWLYSRQLLDDEERALSNSVNANRTSYLACERFMSSKKIVKE